jgi:hypothetical protein
MTALADQIRDAFDGLTDPEGLPIPLDDPDILEILDLADDLEDEEE